MQNLKIYMKVHKNTIISLSIILLSGLLSITWFGDHFLVTGTDLVFPPSRWEAFLQTFYVWDTRSLGASNPRLLAWSIPQGVFLGISEVIGLSLADSEKLWFYFQYTFAGLSMYYLSVTMVKSKYRHFSGIFSAFFYMLNPYIAIGITNFPNLLLTYTFLPLKLALFIKGIDERKGLRYAFLICVLWLVTSTSQFVNPKYVIFDWMPLFLYLIYHLLVNRNKEEIIQSLRFTGVFLALWTAFNIYWILPVSFSLEEVIKSPLIVYETIGRSRLGDYMVNSAPLLEAMRLLGLWALHSGYKGYPYFYWGPTYDTPIFVIIGFLIPLIGFIPLLFKPIKVHTLFFSLITLGALSLMSGVYSPLGWVNAWLFIHIPLISEVFTLPYCIFGMYATLGYSFLIGCGITTLYNYIQNIRLPFSVNKFHTVVSKTIIGFTIFMIVGLYAFPLWTGDVMYPGNNVLASSRYKIPDYYYEASDWLGVQHDDFNIFPLPYSIIGYNAYTWEPAGFHGPDPTESILSRPVVSSMSGGGIGIFVSEYVVNNSANNISKVLSLMNAKYALFHRDANYLFYSGHPWYISTSSEKLQSILNSQEALYLEKSFGELDFYRNEYWKPMHLYAASYTILVHGGSNEMVEVVESNNFTSGEFVLFLSDQLTLEQYSFVAKLDNYDLKPNIRFEKINPTKYIVHVNASNPFFLVFSESYHKDWVAYTNGEQVPGEGHLMANGYANAWFINKTGSYDIVLEFWPQKLFYIGSAASITTLILCTLYISKNKIKTAYTRYAKKRNKKNT